MKKVLKALAIAATVVVALVSCKKEAQEVALTGIELNAVTQALQVGQDFQLTVTYKPADATNKPAATWESDTPAVATVADGKVTAVAAGTAKITAKVASFSATCTVTVTEESSGEVDLSGADVWSLIGDFNSWDADVDLQKTASSPETWEVKGVALSGGVKFRGNHEWGNYDLGAKDAVESGKELALVHKGGNITVAEGTYDVVLYPTELKAVFTLAEGPEPQGIITIDGDFSDWADIEGVSDGTYGQLKVALDENYIYFLSHRTTAGRYSEIWNGGGYVYFGLNLDGDDSTGETLNGVGPYEFVFFISPYGGSADAPAIAEDFTVLGYGAGCLPSTCSIKNVFGKGAVTDEGAIIEFKVPLEDIPELPESFTVYSQGNKDLAKVVYPFPYVAPEPEYLIDIDGDFSDWLAADVDIVEYDNHAVMIAMDEYNLYVYSERPYDSDFPWGDDEAYVYFGLDTDKNLTTGDMTLWGNGPFEYVGVIWPYGGTASAPAINKNPGSAYGNEGKAIAGVVCDGAISDDTVAIEFSVPLSSLCTIPSTPFIIYSWGSPKLAKVEYHIGEPQPEPEPVEAPESDVITVDILPNAYPQEEVVVKNGDIEYNIYLVANYGNGIQMKKEGGYISNKTAFKSINTIKITTAESKTLYPENLKLYAGTTENPTTEIPMKSGDKEVAVWELDGEYTYFKMENVSTYAVYLSKIEINPAAEPAPAGITLDGNFDDWADIDAIANEESNSINEWKYASDSKNFYFYLKISKSDIKAEKAERPEGSGLFPFEKRRYIYIALNTDNNDATGFTPSYGDMTIPGAEVLSLIYPFRGNSTVAQGTDGSEVVNGVDSNSWVGVLSSASERSKTGEQLSAYGVIDDDYGYLEVALPRAGAQLAAGTYKVQFSLSSTLSHVFEMVIE